MRNKLVSVERKLNECIKDLKNKKIKDFYDIPEEFRNNEEIVNIERKLGIRKSDKRGYDVIRGEFFVDEIIMTKNYEYKFVEDSITNTFTDFENYYEFLNGDIYENACYYQCDFSSEIISKYKLIKNRLNMYSTMKETVDDFLPELSNEEIEEYEKYERKKKILKNWIKRFNACSTYDELLNICYEHIMSKPEFYAETSFYLWNYMNYHKEKSIDIMMRFVSCDKDYIKSYIERFHSTDDADVENIYSNYLYYIDDCARQIKYALYFVFGTKRVLQEYDYKGGSNSTNKKYNARYKSILSEIINIGVEKKVIKYFSRWTHYYVVMTEIYLKSNNKRPITKLYKYFETFEEFAEYLENDISDCDLSQALSLTIDLDKYKVNEKTKLPIKDSYVDLKRVIFKKFNRKKKQFEVVIKWYYSNNIEVFRKYSSFRFFFDFVAFLKNDLSYADLLFCDGLSNMVDLSSINLENARLRSSICKKAGMAYKKDFITNNYEKEFAIPEMNEKETLPSLKKERQTLCEYEDETKDKMIYYITDLHLIHRIRHANCITKDDCIYIIQLIIDRLFENDLHDNSIILIGGDVSSEFTIFKLFVELLRNNINDRKRNVKVIFTLGNHELWDFKNKNMESIVQIYRELLSDYDMYLLHNEILYTDDNNNIAYMTSQEINSLSEKDIREKLRMARIILFGGVGFSGYNKKFNANDGVYKMTLSREQEITETKFFERLYHKICDSIPDRNVIILTHMPFEDWNSNNKKHNNYVYVYGHNHRNMFYDDGAIRIYSDNQIGYYCENPRLKNFYIDDTYDLFFDYDEGIYQITRDEYIDFYRGKNLQITYNRKVNELYMLKKKNYYCFIHRNASGGLTILNGGSLKTLKTNGIMYYYNNMDEQIAFIKKPLDKFLTIQKKISDAIKHIGGSGHIHGAIIDIDYYNHIYVNPYDLSIVSYFALDVVNKYVYPSIQALLKSECPMLYQKHNEYLTSEDKRVLSIRNDNDKKLLVKPKLYTSTDIYTVSRELKKMQKLETNILSVWYDKVSDTKKLTQKDKNIIE